MQDKPNFGPLTFGFDIGIASVGWAVLAPDFIVDLGVRAFDKAETADKGESLNLARRQARLARRRLRRRAWRLTKLRRLLKRYGVVTATGDLTTPSACARSPWQLRVEGLDRRLDPHEWARVLYHLCKHRGFHWISRAEERKASEDEEGGRVKQGLAGTRKRMLERRYRTVAEMILAEFPCAQRNKQGQYDKAIERTLLGEELTTLFQRQRALGNPHASPELEEHILGHGDHRSGLFWEQKPPLSGNNLLEMVGRCTLESLGGPDGKGEFRAPKASFTAERHVWLTRLNNLRISVNGHVRGLNEAERNVVLPLPYLRASALTYQDVRNALLKAGLLPEAFHFTALRYPTGDGGKNPEAEKLIRLPAWHQLRKTLKEHGLETEWQGMAGAALSGNPEYLDQIAQVLSVFKDGDEVERELRKLNLPGGEAMVSALSELSFNEFHALSLKALRKIVPFMEAGQRYDEACVSAGYHHSRRFVAGQGLHDYLPSFYTGRDEKGRLTLRAGDIPRNPVVLRALNQARKVLNALVHKYGAPTAIHIEMARDLSRAKDERDRIKKEQEALRDHNLKAREEFALDHGMEPSGRQFEKYLLYREQHGKCAYSLETLDFDRVLRDPGYAEIDHALPYSRSYDDGKNNKVLVLSRENRNKGNRTPYEYLTSFPGGEGGERWQNFVAYVQGNPSFRAAKKSRLLRKNFGEEEAREFSERNLNDTRYICRFFKNYVEQHLKFAPDCSGQPCVVVSGQLTAFLRKRWGLNKARGENDRHHALDAAVVAACSHTLVKRLSDYSRRKELENAKNVIDATTGEILDTTLLEKLERDFPRPWPHFREELLLRLNAGDIQVLRTEAIQRFNYPRNAIPLLRPLFVSRAPQRRNGGALHQATLRSPKLINDRKSHVRVDIRKLRLSDLDRIHDAKDPRNAALIEALRARLEAHGNDAKKAFAEPFHKPSGHGKTPPIVRTVKLVTTQNSGARVGNAIADLGEMLRVDVYRVGSRHFLMPRYGIPEEHRINAVKKPDDAMFLFSLTKNDFVEVTFGTETVRGYFVMYESDGRMTLRAHDQPQPDKTYFRRSVSSASSIKKFHVDVLGNLFPANEAL